MLPVKFFGDPMESIFDPTAQPDNLDGKLILTLEKLSEVLRLLLWDKAKTWQLSPIQIQILIFLHYHRDEKPQITHLAERFNLTKATVSDAVKSLTQKQLVRKSPSPTDGRKTILSLTPEGEAAVSQLNTWPAALQRVLAPLPEADKATTYQTLLRVIASLEQSGLIHLNRICLTCRFYRRGDAPGENDYCQLLEKPLRPAELRIDCPEHQPA